MKNNSEIKIAAVVAALMIIICVVIIIVNKTDNQEIDLQVYKNVEIDGKRGYIPCEVPDTILMEINTEFKKAKQLSDKKQAEVEQITGEYKLVSDKTSMAFDNNDKNKIYNINKNKLYNFDSTIYNLVISVCE